MTNRYHVLVKARKGFAMNAERESLSSEFQEQRHGKVYATIESGNIAIDLDLAKEGNKKIKLSFLDAIKLYEELGKTLRYCSKHIIGAAEAADIIDKKIGNIK